MKILITGATGFIGSHLFRTLVRMGHECIGMDNQFIETDVEWAYKFAEENKNAQFFLGDEGDCSNGWNVFKICKNFSPDVIFNLAVMCLPHSLIEPIENYSKNIEITTNIVQEATKRNIRLVHFSSSEVYGSAEEETMSEDHKLRPSTPYAAAKAACDHLVQSMVNTFELDAAIVRPFNTYGPGQNENTYAAVIPKMIKTMLNGETPKITGDGTQTRDFNYVTDVVDAAILAGERGKLGEVYNICSGKETSINDIVGTIASVMGLDEIEVNYIDKRPGDVMRHRGDGSKAAVELGWKPRTSMEDGLKETIEWYKRSIKTKGNK